MSVDPALTAWLVENDLSDKISIDALVENEITTLEDFLWIAINSCYKEEFAQIVKPVGRRARVHRLLLAHPAASNLPSNAVAVGSPYHHPLPLNGALTISDGTSTLSEVQNRPALQAASAAPMPIKYPLDGQHVLQVYWDIENVVSVKEEVPNFMNLVVKKLIDEGIIRSRANVKFHVVAQIETLTRFANQLRGANLHFVHTQKGRKEATDREIEGLVRDVLTTTTPAHVPALMLITSDCDFMNLMAEVMRTHRDMFLIHRAQEKNIKQQERLSFHATRAWSWRDIYTVAERAPVPLAAIPVGTAIDNPAPDVYDPSAVYAGPPKTLQEVMARLEGRTQLLLVCEALKYGRKHPEAMTAQYESWKDLKMNFPDETYTAFYLYRDASKRGICTKFNGIRDGKPSYCNIQDKFGTVCGFLHICLFCEKQGHGWYSDCPAYATYEQELLSLGITDERDFDTYVDIYCGTDQAAITTDNTELMQQEETNTVFDLSSEDSASEVSSNETPENAGAHARVARTVAEITRGPTIPRPNNLGKHVLAGVFYRDDLADVLANSPELKAFVWTIGGVLFSRDKQAQARKCLAQWKEKRVPLTSEYFAAYYVARGENYCCRLNGPGPEVGVGYGACNHEARTGTECSFVHKCLRCDNNDHGWFDFNVCPKRGLIYRELRELDLSHKDVPKLILIYGKEGRKATFVKDLPATIRSPAPTPKSKSAQEAPKYIEPAPPTPARDPLPTTAKGVWTLVSDHQELYEFLRAQVFSTTDQVNAAVSNLKVNGFGTVSKEFAAYYRLRMYRNKKNNPNNPELVPCVNYNVGECKYKEHRGAKCPRPHVCVLCESASHGYDDCPRHDKIIEQMKVLHLTDADLDALAEIVRRSKENEY